MKENRNEGREKRRKKKKGENECRNQFYFSLLQTASQCMVKEKLNILGLFQVVIQVVVVVVIVIVMVINCFICMTASFYSICKSMYMTIKI